MENKTELNLKLSTSDSFSEDDIKETIVGYGDNFIKLYNHIGAGTESGTPFKTGEKYKKTQKIWNGNPLVGEYVGWINLREGIYAPKRQNLHNYSLEDLITNSGNNGYYYECIERGKSSVTEPVFLTSDDAEFYDVETDGWVANKVYSVNDTVFESSGSKLFYYVCETAGMSDVGEPSWSNVAEGTVVLDGSITWRKEKNVKWKRMAYSANFRPFGKID